MRRSCAHAWSRRHASGCDITNDVITSFGDSSGAQSDRRPATSTACTMLQPLSLSDVLRHACYCSHCSCCYTDRGGTVIFRLVAGKQQRQQLKLYATGSVSQLLVVSSSAGCSNWLVRPWLVCHTVTFTANEKHAVCARSRLSIRGRHGQLFRLYSWYIIERTSLARR